MIIEFSGLPGSGKSAIIKSLRRKFRKSGIPLVPAQKTGGQSSTVKEVMNNRWVNNWDGRALLYLANLFSRRHQAFFDHIRQSPVDATADEEFLLQLTGVRFLQASDPELHDKMVVFDEGFFHRGIHLINSHEKRLSSLSHYIEKMPLADAVVHLETDADVAYDRCITRRAAGSLQDKHNFVVKKFGDVPAFQQRKSVMEDALQLVEKRGGRVFRIDNHVALASSVEATKKCLTKLWEDRV